MSDPSSSSSSSSASSSTSKIFEQHWDIIVVGTGAAALTAALSAATTTTTSSSSAATPTPLQILLLDKAPESWAGGNGYFTAAAYRTVHNGLEDMLPLVSNVPDNLKGKIDLPAYREEDFLGDWERVTGGKGDRGLVGAVVRGSWGLVRWLGEVGRVRWELSFRRQAYWVEEGKGEGEGEGGRYVFWGGLCLTCAGGGKGLVGDLRGSVEGRGCVFAFGTRARRILVDGEGTVRGLEVERLDSGGGGEVRELRAKSVILCAGGFEANPELRRKWMGEGWELAHTRGTPYNTGDMLLAAIDLGAKTVGDFSRTGCHSVAWDADSPREGGDREKTNEFTKSGYPLGLMINSEGKRFVDEGVDLRNYTYARFGRAILEQPDGIAWQVWDADGQQWLRAEEYRDEIVRKTTADSIESLAKMLEAEGLSDSNQFVQTIREYNEAVALHRREHPDAKLNPAIRDGLSTQSSTKSLPLAKSNWAMPIQKPPFLAVKVTSGITFTFAGLAIEPETATVLREDGSHIVGLHCAGEMVGGLFYGNYPGGSGLTAGGVFGRRAGRAAALRAQEAGR